MNTKAVPPIVAILAVMAGLLWYYGGPPFGQDEAGPTEMEVPLDEATLPSEPAVVISFTNDGYSPKEVSIQRGDIVRFTNNSTDLETWPASAVHPTHSIYPEKTEGDCLGSAFDACRGLKFGESWDFRFTKAGEWRFHDHINASKTGVVRVSE